MRSVKAMAILVKVALMGPSLLFESENCTPPISLGPKQKLKNIEAPARRAHPLFGAVSTRQRYRRLPDATPFIILKFLGRPWVATSSGG